MHIISEELDDVKWEITENSGGSASQRKSPEGWWEYGDKSSLG
jgi:hypothetical protein